MGLYRIPVRPDKVNALPRLMKAIGFPVVRTEKQENGTCFFCANPKRSNKTWMCWITREKEMCPRFFMCGLSQLSKQIVNALSVEGLFDRERSVQGEHTGPAEKFSRGHSPAI